MRLLPLTTRRGLLLVVLAFAFTSYRSLPDAYQPNTWLFADGSFYFTTLRSIVDHGRLEQRALQPQSWYVQDLGWNKSLTDDWSNVSQGVNGGWYPKHCILLPLLSVPFYWIFGTVGTLVLNVLMNLVFVILAFLLARRFGRVEIAALLAGGICWYDFVQGMSYTYSNDLLSADLVLGAIEATFAGYFGLAGLLTGFSLWSRVTNGAFLPALVIIGVTEGGWRKVGRAALFALIPVSVYGALNWYMFGAPWIMSYERVIVREHGAKTVASHTRLFNVPWREGARRIVFGDDGAFKTYPLLIPGLVGMGALLFRRRWAVSLAFILFCVLPAITFMKYDWYRPHFLYPLLGAAVLGSAALASILPWFRPQQYESAPLRIPVWVWPLLAVVVIGAGVVWRLRHRRPEDLLSTHITEAQVRLDDIPCDYWNPQVERWECSSFDQGGDAMTGGMTTPLNIRGEPVKGLWVLPSKRSRKIIFRMLPKDHVDLKFALDDESPAGPIQVEVIARGHPPAKLTLEHPSQVETLSVDIGRGISPALEVRVASPTPHGQRLIFDGKMR